MCTVFWLPLRLCMMWNISITPEVLCALPHPPLSSTTTDQFISPDGHIDGVTQRVSFCVRLLFLGIMKWDSFMWLCGSDSLIFHHSMLFLLWVNHNLFILLLTEAWVVCSSWIWRAKLLCASLHMPSWRSPVSVGYMPRTGTAGHAWGAWIWSW